MVKKKDNGEETVKPFRGKEYRLDESQAKLLNKIRQLENEKADLKRGLYIARQEIQSLKEECDRVKEDASVDDLTGVKNRKAFDMFLRKEIILLPTFDEKRQTTSDSLAMLMVDADHFKSINDDFGHSTGDEILVAIARALEESVRASDTVCRWGGEEFVVIVPNITAEQLKSLGEKIRATISNVTFSETPELKVTVSIGGSVQFHQSDKELFERADAAMYAAKQNGRNQVVIT